MTAPLPLTQTNPFRFRSLIFGISPTWLQGRWGQAFLGTVGLFFDAVSEWERQSTRARLPMDDGVPEGQLEQIGADRLIPRGSSETDASYAQRLRYALLSWQRAGSAEAILRALASWSLPTITPLVAIPQGVNFNRRTWYSLFSYDAPCVANLDASTVWNWDGIDAKWARVWVSLDMTELGIGRKHIGAWTIGPATSIGANAPPAYFSGLRALASQWKSAQTIVTIMLSYDAAWPVMGGYGDNYPNGTWGLHYLPSTFASARYRKALYLEPVS